MLIIIQSKKSMVENIDVIAHAIQYIVLCLYCSLYTVKISSTFSDVFLKCTNVVCNA